MVVRYMTQADPVPLGKDYVRAVRWRTVGPAHGVWRDYPGVTCCGMRFTMETASYVQEPIACRNCLGRLRSQGWAV